MKIILTVILILLLAACSAPSRYQQSKDSMPHKLPENFAAESAKPKYEPYYSPSLRAYKVLGKRYYPLATGKGYEAKGKASWYGKKFHGHLTANGERYNMYSMSAAHKTLPLPSYVKVTNLDNGRSAVVRVNDRGPFHDSRLIDVSYAAALKLGFLQQGVANVALQVMHVDASGQLTVGNQPTNQSQPYVQVVALQDKHKAQKLASQLSQQYQVSTHIPKENGLYKLRLGPLLDPQALIALLNRLKSDGYAQAFKINALPGEG